MTKKFQRFFFIAIIFSLLAGVPLVLGGQPAQTGSVEAAEASLDPSTSYLPVMRKAPLPNLFGVDMGSIEVNHGLNMFKENGTHWIRRTNLIWAEVEPTEGARNWDVLADMEQEMIEAAQREMPVIMVVSKSPAWARLLPSYSCGPVRSDKFAAFGRFMHDLVDRYSRPPYNVLYWEVWNEPDAPPNSVTESTLFGCWGDANDPYYGGRYYGDMLEVVGPQIKAANPNAKVLFGGLLLDCNPNFDSNCLKGKFFEGALLSGAGPHFDAVSFHAYDIYYAPAQGIGVYGQTVWNSTYNTTGAVTHAKTQFVKGLLASFGHPNKMLMNTEVGLLCLPLNHQNCELGPTSDFELTKAYYVPQAYGAAIAEGLVANVWYNVFGWRDSGLLEFNLDPKPAYHAFVFARAEIKNASYVRQITEYNNTLGYVLDRGDKIIWVIWSNNGSNHTITLPSTPDAIFDVFGVEDTNPSTSLTVTPKPLYLEYPG